MSYICKPQQFELTLIEHEVQGAPVQQRSKDGYINATAMCRIAGRQWHDFYRQKTTGPFLAELSSETGIPVSELAQSLKGGDVRLQGTWVHPDVAVYLAQWLSPKFAVQVSRWVREWITGAQLRPSGSYHIRRYASNMHNVPLGHWSMLQEMMMHVIGPMETRGYVLPENLLPDISEGRMFCKYLRDVQGIDTDSLPTYQHVFEDGRKVTPKAYPDRLLPEFRAHLLGVWVPTKALDYFKGRDPVALEYLPYLLNRSGA